MSQEIMRALGRIEGRLEGIEATQVANGDKIDAVDGRLQTVEKQAAAKGGGAGLFAGVGVTLIVEGLKRVAGGGM